MQKFWIFLFLACLFLPTANAHASEGMTTKEFLSNCEDPTGKDATATLKSVHCYGYLSGIADSITILFSVKPEAKFFCPPSQGISAEQFLQLVKTYVAEKPEELDKSARMSAFLSYALAFPCK